MAMLFLRFRKQAQPWRYSIQTFGYDMSYNIRLLTSSMSHVIVIEKSIRPFDHHYRRRRRLLYSMIGPYNDFNTGSNSYYHNKSTILYYSKWRIFDSTHSATKFVPLRLQWRNVRMMMMMMMMQRGLPPQCRTMAAAAAWWRRGGAGGKSSSPNNNYYFPPSSLITDDVSKKRQYPNAIVNDEYRISICSIQGYRKYMEDEFMIHTTPNNNTNDDHNDIDSCVVSDGIVGCFDGHGGKAVARYLRQNLYINLQAALQMIQQTKPVTMIPPPPPEPMDAPPTNVDNVDDEEEEDGDENATFQHNNDEGHPNTNLDENNIHNLKFDDEYLVSGIPSTTTIVTPPTRGTSIPSSTTVPVVSTTNTSTVSVDDYVSALEVALDKVDREVLKVKHWRFQGSTAIVCWIHTAITTTNESPNIIEASADAGTGTITIEKKVDDKNTDDPQSNTSLVRTLITANIGDSRAILCRNGTAIALSRDHKPNDPIEYQRIRQLGGIVTWDGEVDRMREPIPGMGFYRINGNIALSRVIGDRALRPVVNSDPDITLITLLPDDDEFIVVATDGLWDVMSSSDTVAFIHALLNNMDQDSIDRDSIATYVVEEALRRGCHDNVTVIIVWLK